MIGQALPGREGATRDGPAALAGAVVRSAAFGSVATAFVAQAALVTSGVLAARMLGAENRGHLALLALVPLILTHLGTLGIPVATTYYIARGDQSALALVRSALRLLTPIGAALVAVHAAVLVVTVRGEPLSVQLAALTTLVTVPGMAAQMLGLAVLQGQQRFRTFNLLRLPQVILYSSAIAVLFLTGTNSLVAVALIWSSIVLVTGALTAFVALAGWQETAQGELARGKPSDLIRFGLKSLPSNISPIETFRLDQVIVGILAGPAALGLYVVGTAFTNLPRFVGKSVGLVVYPKVASSIAPGKLIVAYLLITLAVCGGIVLTLELLMAELVPLFFGSEFTEAIALARILLLAALLFSLRWVMNDSSRGFGHPEWSLAGEIAFWPAFALVLLTLGAAAQNVAWAVVAGAGTSLLVTTFLVAMVGVAFQHAESSPVDNSDNSFEEDEALPRLAFGKGT
jgi:O-antigen/teichoic acid export membrane protein